MPFKFKLSKRLALIKASLAASVVLALACERDLTDPQPSRIPLTQVVTSLDLTPLPVASVSASGDDGNIPQNTLDNNLATVASATASVPSGPSSSAGTAAPTPSSTAPPRPS